MSSTPSTPADGGGVERARPFDRTIDWIVGVIVVVGGVLTALAGTLLFYGVTRPLVAEAVRESVRSGEFHADGLTNAQAIDLLVAFGNWGGLGLIVAGTIVALLGIALVVVHGRVRRSDEQTPAWIIGVVGALVATVLSFLPFSPLFGGAIAGYLSPTSGASGLKTGTLSGLFGCIPPIVTAVFVGVGVFATLPSEIAVVAAVLVALAVLFSLVYFLGLGALGGYLGGWFRTR